MRKNLDFYEAFFLNKKKITTQHFQHSPLWRHLVDKCINSSLNPQHEMNQFITTAAVKHQDTFQSDIRQSSCFKQVFFVGEKIKLHWFYE